MSRPHPDSFWLKAKSAERQLRESGFDLVRWFSTDELNSRLPAKYRIPPRGAAGVIVGNTAALWAPFSKARLACPHPLDRYVEQELEKALLPVEPKLLRFSHQVDPSPIPIQRYAEAAGLCFTSPVGLSIHTSHGPWFALRAVALFDAEPPPRPTEKIAAPCVDCERPCIAPFRRAVSKEPRRLIDFLPVRNACPVGRASAYSEEQIAFHYRVEADGTLGD